MTVSTTTNKNTYSGNGSTSVFPYTFRILSQSEILVQTVVTATGVTTDLTLTTDYTVSSVGVTTGGNITILSPSTKLPTGTTLVLKRNVSAVQETDYQENDPFPAETHETALDRLTMLVQQIIEGVDRSMKIDSSLLGYTNTIVGVPSAAAFPIINPANNGWVWGNVASIASYNFPLTTGILVQSASLTAITRTNTGTANEITVTNGDGVSGNPAYSLPAALIFTGKTVTGGTFSTITMSATWAGNPTFSGALSLTSSVFSSYLNEAQASNIASASTTDIGAVLGNYVKVTGTTTITALGTVQAGTRRVVEFTGTLTLTHNATSLILPSSGNLTTAAGDCATFISEGSGNWRCVNYTRANGYAILPTTDATITTTDITTNDVTTSKHGWMAKAPNTSTVWLGNATYNQVPLTTHVTGVLPVANGGTGVSNSKPILQTVTAAGSATSGTTIMPFDNTDPQNTEGIQVVTANITPLNSANKLIILVNVWAANSVLQEQGVALFQDSIASALAAASSYITAINQNVVIPLVYEMAAGTTSTITFAVRTGGNNAGTTTFKGNSGASIYNNAGANGVTIQIFEVAA